MYARHSSEALFNHASIGLIICNGRGEIIDFNRQSELQFGYTRSEVLGKKVEMLLPAAYRDSHVTARTAFSRHPTPRVMGAGRELFALKKDGTEFPVEISLSNYVHDGENYVIAFVADITIRKNSEEAMHQQRTALEIASKKIAALNTDLEQKVENRTRMLQETLAALERSREELSEALEREKELGELKTRFVAIASHEFRTPLSTILSSAFLLSKYRRDKDDEKAEKHIRRIKDAVANMKAILEDFLSLEKLEEGIIRPKVERMEVSRCLREVEETLLTLQSIAKDGQKILLAYDCDGEINIDLYLLKNILINLVSNAIKFSPENSNIEVGLHYTSEGLLLNITDHGIGISIEDQQHLFERFFRAKNALATQGTGLGLHIVGKYLELLHGQIEIHSQLNRGTTFIVHIPLQINARYEKDLADRRQ